MNIVEKYIEVNGGILILISGLSGTGKTKLAKNIARDFKIDLINENKYCDKEYYKIAEKIINNGGYEQEKNMHMFSESEKKESYILDSDDIYKWNSLNEDIEKHKNVVVSGTAFPKDKINRKVDFHIHIKMNNKNMIIRRNEFTLDHDCYEDFDEKYFNKYTYPYYLDLVKRMDINKFINGNNYMDFADYDEKIYDEAFSYIIDYISKFLNQ